MANRAERVGSAVLLALSVAYVIVAMRLPSESPNVSDVGPRLYPLTVGTIMVVLCATWLFQAFRADAKDANAELEDGDAPATAWLRVGLLALVSALFPIFMRPLGFVATAAVFLFVSINIVSWERSGWRRWLWIAALSIVSGFFLKWLFSDVLSIYLP